MTAERIFQAGADPALGSQSNRQRVLGHRPWLLGGPICSVCNIGWWCYSGMEFPAVELSAGDGEREFRRAGVRTFYRDLAIQLARWQRIAHRFPPLPFTPWGAGMGPLTGSATGEFGDFAWPGVGYIILLQRACLLRLAEAGVRLPSAVPTRLRFKRRTYPELVELQLDIAGPPVSPHGTSGSWHRCAGCGYPEFLNLRGLSLDSRTIPGDVDIFRPEYSPSRIFVTERFRATVQDLGLTDIAFEPVPVA